MILIKLIFYKSWVEDQQDVIDILKERVIQRVDTTDHAPIQNSDSTTEVLRKLTGNYSHIASIWSLMKENRLLLKLLKLAELPLINI